MSALWEQLQRARLYLVCADIGERRLEAALRGGVDMVQLRCKESADEEILGAAARLAPICRSCGAPFILNDRPDLVVAAGADGAHVGQDDMSVADARGLIGSDRILGLSTHSQAQVDAAGAAPVDYIGVGPVHATPTKAGRPAVGLELVRYAAARARSPFFAIGGVTVDNVATVRAAGAERVSVVRALTEAADPEAAARELRRHLSPAEGWRGAA